MWFAKKFKSLEPFIETLPCSPQSTARASGVTSASRHILLCRCSLRCTFTIPQSHSNDAASLPPSRELHRFVCVGHCVALAPPRGTDFSMTGPSTVLPSYKQTYHLTGPPPHLYGNAPPPMGKRQQWIDSEVSSAM